MSDTSVKSLFVQKIIQRKPYGRKIRVKVDSDALVYDVLEKSVNLLSLSEESPLSIWIENGCILQEKDPVANIEDLTTFCICELNSDIIIAEQVLDDQTQISSDQPDGFPTPSKEDKEDISSLTGKVIDFYGNSLPPGISVKIFNYFNDRSSHYSRKEFTSERQLHKYRTETFKRSKGFGAYLGLSAGLLESIFGIGVLVDSGAKKGRSSQFERNADSEEKTKEAVVSTICYLHVKKFHVRPVLEEDIVRTARKIITEDNPFDKYAALASTLKFLKTFQDNPKTFFSVPFYCGGSFTIDAIATSTKEQEFSLLAREATKKLDVQPGAGVSPGFGARFFGGGLFNRENQKKDERADEVETKGVSVTFKHESKPENCQSASDVSEKINEGVKFWSITPDLTGNSTETKIDVVKMLKDETRSKDDRVINEAAVFLEQFSEHHNHFIVLGSKQVLRKVLKLLKWKTLFPANFLISSENVHYSFVTTDDFSKIENHKGSNKMFILCENNHKSIQKSLDCISEVPLNEICLLVYKEIHQQQLQKNEFVHEVDCNFGISNFHILDCNNSNDLTRDLLQVYGQKDDVKEKRCYRDFSREKVYIFYI